MASGHRFGLALARRPASRFDHLVKPILVKPMLVKSILVKSVLVKSFLVRPH